VGGTAPICLNDKQAMGLFDWLSKPKSAPVQSAPSSGLARAEPTVPFSRHHKASAAQSRTLPPAEIAGESAGEQKKNARSMRRELLYTVVRESMIRAGVLSQGYKFKALALDPRGLQFIVMVDLAAEFGASQDRWCEIESLIAQTAKARHGVIIKAVYWRLTDQVSLGKPVASALPVAPARGSAPSPVTGPVTAPLPNAPAVAAAVSASSPAPFAQALASASAAYTPAHTPEHVQVTASFAPTVALPKAQPQERTVPTVPLRALGPVSKPMPLFPEAPSSDFQALDLDVGSSRPGTMRPQMPGSGRFEPIADDEVDAFKRALAAGASGRPAVAPVRPAVAAAAVVAADKKPANKQDNYTLLTGFEDTETNDSSFAPPALGSTQYGELR
jgi:hypothetical protein